MGMDNSGAKSVQAPACQIWHQNGKTWFQATISLWREHGISGVGAVLFLKLAFCPKSRWSKRYKCPKVCNGLVYTHFYANNLTAGITISGDGTSHQAKQYDSKFVTVLVPDYQTYISEGDLAVMKPVPADHFLVFPLCHALALIHHSKNITKVCYQNTQVSSPNAKLIRDHTLLLNMTHFCFLHSSQHGLHLLLRCMLPSLS